MRTFNDNLMNDLGIAFRGEGMFLGFDARGTDGNWEWKAMTHAHSEGKEGYGLQSKGKGYYLENGNGKKKGHMYHI